MGKVVDPGVSAEWSFARSARTPGRARRLLREQLAGWGLDEGVRDLAALLLSELVTNSVRHATRPTGRLIAVGAEFAPGWLLRVEVADASEAQPVLRTDPDPDTEGGRGLLLVAALAADWGTYPRRHVGKVVWFTLRVGDAAGAADSGREAGAGSTLDSEYGKPLSDVERDHPVTICPLGR